jgi:hypothetical protein
MATEADLLDRAMAELREARAGEAARKAGA